MALTTLPMAPNRLARLFDAEQGATLQEAQASLLFTLATAATSPLTFRGDAHGVLQTDRFEPACARLAFTSSLGDGHVDLSAEPNGWIMADVFVADQLRLRVWIERAYEEVEFWPNDSSGEGEPPGRISKRQSWLQIDCALFPGVPSDADGLWTLEEAND